MRTLLLLLAGALVPGVHIGAQRQATPPATMALGKAGSAFGPVSFRHRDHARMSEMGPGCAGCHHRDQAGSIRSCSTCHSERRMRDDLDTPDLRGAMHRQCLDCHHTWRAGSACGTCHTNRRSAATPAEPTTRSKRALPASLLYETKAAEGNFVTFSHERHATAFGLRCIRCHQREACATCHASAEAEREGSAQETLGKVRARATAVSRSTTDAHTRCATCHRGDACARCHTARPVQDSAFNHLARANWALNRFHVTLTCQRCHPVAGTFTKIRSDCEACHANWQQKFDHTKAGLALDDLHSGASCVDCHKDPTFTAAPACGDCHTDKAWPADKPGKVVPGVKQPSAARTPPGQPRSPD